MLPATRHRYAQCTPRLNPGMVPTTLQNSFSLTFQDKMNHFPWLIWARRIIMSVFNRFQSHSKWEWCKKLNSAGTNNLQAKQAEKFSIVVRSLCTTVQIFSASLLIFAHWYFYIPWLSLTIRTMPNQRGRYLIYLPQWDGRLTWPRRLVTYRDGLPARRQSPIQVPTRPSIEQLHWSDTTRYHYVTTPTPDSKGKKLPIQTFRTISRLSCGMSPCRTCASAVMAFDVARRSASRFVSQKTIARPCAPLYTCSVLTITDVRERSGQLTARCCKYPRPYHHQNNNIWRDTYKKDSSQCCVTMLQINSMWW